LNEKYLSSELERNIPKRVEEVLDPTVLTSEEGKQFDLNKKLDQMDE
jgi:hypothetical protein